MLNRLGKHNDAIRIANKMAAETVTNDFLLSDIRLEIARGNEGLDYRDIAIANYHKSVKLNGKNYNALLGLGRMYRKFGDYRNSRKHLEEARDIYNLRAPEAHYELGLTYLAEGNQQDALEEFKLALSQLPSREIKKKASEKKLEIMGRS